MEGSVSVPVGETVSADHDEPPLVVRSTTNPVLTKPAAQHSSLLDITTHEMEYIVPTAVPGRDSAVQLLPEVEVP
jgi:hypothetical protein